MADIERLIPFLIKWETGVVKKPNETAEALFERSRKKGFACIAGDRGGATQSGITIGTYKSYCRRHGIAEPTVNDLKNITYQTWLAVLKEGFWDKWKADEIDSQNVANMLVDWVWHSGNAGIKKPQELLGVVPDGLVGKKTLAAVNSRGPVTLFHQLKSARLKYFDDIVKSRPSQKKFLQGWRNRVNDLRYE